MDFAEFVVVDNTLKQSLEMGLKASEETGKNGEGIWMGQEEWSEADD